MYRGVYRTSWGNRWQASIYRHGKRYYLGTFDNEESAARAYDDAALSLRGPGTALNFSRREDIRHGGQREQEHVDTSDDD